MEVFQQMIYYIRSIQRLDNYLKYQTKKLDWIVRFKKENEEYTLNHPIRKNLNPSDLQMLSDRLEKVTYGVTHNFLWAYDKCRKNYTYNIITNYLDLLKNQVLSTLFVENMNELMYQNAKSMKQTLQNLFKEIEEKLKKSNLTNQDYIYLKTHIIWVNNVSNKIKELSYGNADPNFNSVIEVISFYKKSLIKQYQGLIDNNVHQDLETLLKSIETENSDIYERLYNNQDVSSVLNECLRNLEKYNCILELHDSIKIAVDQRTFDIQTSLNALDQFNNAKGKIDSVENLAKVAQISHFYKEFLKDKHEIQSKANNELSKFLDTIFKYIDNYFKVIQTSGIKSEASNLKNETSDIKSEKLEIKKEQFDI